MCDTTSMPCQHTELPRHATLAKCMPRRQEANSGNFNIITTLQSHILSGHQVGDYRGIALYLTLYIHSLETKHKR